MFAQNLRRLQESSQAPMHDLVAEALSSAAVVLDEKFARVNAVKKLLRRFVNRK